jgi:hypothetical protein
MSLSPTPINDVPELTAQVARATFPNGNWYMQMRDTLGTIDAAGLMLDSRVLCDQ